ncbi:hypothetical protein HDU92_003136, partial [Lobulomyces angularis]
ELLKKLNLEELKEIEFINATSIDAAIKNYSILEKSLREKLGISLSSNNAVDLVTCKKGCASKLLYQIKSAVAVKNSVKTKEEKLRILKLEQDYNKDESFFKDSLHNNDVFDVENFKRSRPNSASSYPASVDSVLPVLPKFQFNNPSKKEFNEQQHRYFSELLRSKLKRGDTINITKTDDNKKFNISEKPNELKKKKNFNIKQLKTINQPEPFFVDNSELNTFIPNKKREIPLWDDATTLQSLTDSTNSAKFPFSSDFNGTNNFKEKLKADKEKLLQKKNIEKINKFFDEVNDFESKLNSIKKTKALLTRKRSNNNKEFLLNPSIDDANNASKKEGEEIDDTKFQETNCFNVEKDEEEKDESDEIKRFLASKAGLDSISHLKTIRKNAPSSAETKSLLKKQLGNIRV